MGPVICHHSAHLCRPAGLTLSSGVGSGSEQQRRPDRPIPDAAKRVRQRSNQASMILLNPSGYGRLIRAHRR